MKTLIAVSDSHGNRRILEKVADRMAECDLVLHLGDCARDADFLRARFPDKLFAVKGNCDGWDSRPDEQIIEVEGIRMLLTHGHRYGVKSDLTRLAFRMRELGVRYAFFGHTHLSGIFTDGELTMINPGSVSRPFLSHAGYSYSVAANGKLLTKIVQLEE